ncbi:MAG: pantoate--beta-alanine ligase, partial [Planctomycetes bacterium]|nr:pantoate--beta-alanine ligase [Planctomycetota bacterium]
MNLVKGIDEARDAVRRMQRAGGRVGLVPTMGALHEGHLSLVRAARERCTAVAVTIFVNPLQFGPNEDFDAYPRPLEADLAACEAEGVDLVFAPPADVMYPTNVLTKVRVSRITDVLCGAHRPGHFDGVTTVVNKLFNILPADSAFFGEKDLAIHWPL